MTNKDQVRFVAVCDADSEHLAFAKEKVDALSIALPDRSHGIIYTEVFNYK